MPVCRQPTQMCYCIQIYGPVVRLAPNELSFGDSTAWQDIYGETSALC